MDDSRLPDSVGLHVATPFYTSIVRVLPQLDEAFVDSGAPRPIRALTQFKLGPKTHDRVLLLRPIH